MSTANLVSKRSLDPSAEKAVQGFLDANFYPKRPGGKSFEVRYDVREMVLCGVDVRSGNDYVDEKLCISNGELNHVPKEVRLELSFLNRRGGVQDGCFLRKGISATTYLFVFMFTDETGRIESTSNIDHAVVVEVSRDELLRAMAMSGDPVAYVAHELREDRDNLVWAFDHGCYRVEKFPDDPECPISLVVDVGYLRTFPSTKAYHVDRNTVRPYDWV